MRVVRAAIAARTTSAADNGKASVWCSPIPKKSMATWSARTPCSTRLRIVCACDSGRSRSSCVTSPNVSSPKTRGNGFGGAVIMSGLISLAGIWAIGCIELGGFGAHGPFELGSAQRSSEHRTAGVEQAARPQAIEPDGVEADPFDDLRDDFHGFRVVACG